MSNRMISPIGVLDRLARHGRIRPRRCGLETCERATKGGKPFCVDHVAQQPYVQELMAKMAAREEEEARVRRLGAGAVDPEGITAREILAYLLIQGPSTVRRLAHELHLEGRTVEGYVRGLQRAGRVATSRNRRGGLVVTRVESTTDAQAA